MILKEKSGIHGRIKIEIRSADGKLKESFFEHIQNKITGGWIHNITTQAGKAQLALLAGASGNLFTYLAVGTSSTAVAATDTQLGAELSTLNLGRAAASVSRVTTTNANDTLQLVYMWTASGGTTVQEAGIFNAASTGTMLGHALTGAKVLAASDTLTLTYQVQFI